ncbi:hypothetical protein SteCoe_38872 [Stentor coeruleus]|uniref:C2H2-type domain-containing protein n=1 Tax=Stentor coeruleus TaxID=5963 RepID=A0A1R2AL20_9CILI|nr:hypothetical protein SteCoe_38872 [Stentor coeruleus]
MDDITQNNLHSIQDNEIPIDKYKCKYCFRILSSRQNLREHAYIHTGEKPYICTEPGCGQAFRQGSLLSIHKKIHIEVKKNKIFSLNSDRKCSFPKLTQMIEKSKIKTSISTSDVPDIKEMLTESEFCFIKKYIN